MKTPAEFFLFLEQSLAALAQSPEPSKAKIIRLYSLVSQFFVVAGESEPLHFTTLFARITHLCNKYRVPARLSRMMQRFRIDAENIQRKGITESGVPEEHIWISGAYALHELASLALQTPVSVSTFTLIGHRAPETSRETFRKGTFKKFANLVAYGIDDAASQLHVYDADDTEARIILKYMDAGRSELFRDNVLRAVDLIGFPFMLNAVDIRIDQDGSYSPRIIVIEPDYLIDISTIAECYMETGGEPRLYLPKKYQEPRTTPHLLIGKIANFFLDELIRDPEQSFEKLFPKVFNLSPLEFATLNDHEVKFMTDECKVHFRNLRHVVLDEMVKLRLPRKQLMIEPSFFAPAFGIQGRLDLFRSGSQERDIIELKSGTPFKANAYGLSSAHYAQTLLYDLMIKAVHDFSGKQQCYILYSRVAGNSLRFAPPVEAIQREVVRLRNELLLTECALGKQKPSEPGLFEDISPLAFPDLKGFVQRELTEFHDTWNGLRSWEKKYIRIFSRFIAREQYLAKVGTHGSDQVNGLASLWLDSEVEKEERFAISRNLTITDIPEHAHEAYIIFAKDAKQEALANFRIGDVAVLYPTLERTPSVLKSQIYKCTVTDLSADHITVRLRSKQASYEDLRRHALWNLEHDLYDRTFDTMHQGLIAFANAPETKRDLFLGLRAPDKPSGPSAYSTEHPNVLQHEMISKIIASNEYFLLWGPPGTGKTSVVLHHVVRHYLLHTNERLILLAYTNRAVDEICDALDRIGGNIREQYVRIGSHIGTALPHRPQLLGNRIEGMQRRKEIVEFLNSQRIVVGTIASIAGKTELFKITKPDIAIIDEASQILEPMLAGLLPLFKKWVLIGDHRQLPAVVAQPPEQTSLREDEISEIGLIDTRDAYFERLFRLCRKNQYDWAYGLLTEQGRMHQEIMAFPGRTFYDDQLRMLPEEVWGSRDYAGPMTTPFAPATDALSQSLAHHRMLWIPSHPEKELLFSKTHNMEAAIVVSILIRLRDLYGKLPDVGVITPFRAQIANIRALLQEQHLDPNQISIDTVERYQGSARDIIILSMSIHHPSMLQRIVSYSQDGIDRKLNVAMTRAREQFILIGSPSVIQSNRTYSALAASCVPVALEDIENVLYSESKTGVQETENSSSTMIRTFQHRNSH